MTNHDNGEEDIINDNDGNNDQLSWMMMMMMMIMMLMHGVAAIALAPNVILFPRHITIIRL